MLQYLNSYFEEHEITAKPTDVKGCMSLKFARTEGFEEFCNGWYIAEHEDGGFSLMFQLDDMIDNKMFSYAWDKCRERFFQVDMTFGDIQGMIPSTGMPRLYFSGKNLHSKQKMSLLVDASFISIACALETVVVYYIATCEEAYGNCAEGDTFDSSRRLAFIEQNINPVDIISIRSCLTGAGLPWSSPENILETGVDDEDVSLWTRCEAGTGGFKDIAGMDEVKERLNNSVVWILTHREEAEKYRISLPNGMLLYGPSGCGKSHFAQKFAEQTGYEYRVVTPSEISSKYVHQTQELIGGLFRDAEKHSPCVICLEEIDAMIPQRSDNENAVCKNDEVNEFLCWLNNCGQKGIFVIGTTNKRNLMDSAALRKGRFDIQVEIPAPDSAQREALFELMLKDRPVDTEVDTERLSSVSDGLVAADIAYVVNEAALESAREGILISENMLEKHVALCLTEKKKGQVRRAGF